MASISDTQWVQDELQKIKFYFGSFIFNNNYLWKKKFLKSIICLNERDMNKAHRNKSKSTHKYSIILE